MWTGRRYKVGKETIHQREKKKKKVAKDQQDFDAKYIYKKMWKINKDETYGKKEICKGLL